MDYQFSNLSTVEECTKLLTVVQKERGALEFRKTALIFRKSSFAENSTEVEAELEAVNAKLETLNNIIPGLPEGEMKEEAELDKMRLEVRKKVLTKSSSSYGEVAVSEKDIDIGRAEAEIAEIDKAIVVIEARKTELESAA